MKKITRVKLLLCVAIILTIVFGNYTYAQNVIWKFDTHTGHEKPAWVEKLTVIDDVSGNGVPEVVAGTVAYGCEAVCIEGATGDIIWDYCMTPDFAPVGDLKTIGDLNGNGSQEVLLARGYIAAIPPIPPSGPELFCLDGITGEEIWSFTPDPQSYISVISLVPDLTGDGVSEIIAGSYDYWVALVDGSNGNQLWLSSVDGKYVQSVSPIEDVNNDGVYDVLMGNWVDGKKTDQNPDLRIQDTASGVYCFSGDDGSMIWGKAIGDIQMNCVKNIADIDGDGKQDVITGTMNGTMYCLSGENGNTIWTIQTPTGIIIQEIVVAQDINGDDKNEIIAGSWDNNVYCFDGATGNILWIYQVVNFVHTVAIAEDISGDGINDILVGDRGLAVGGGICLGAVYCIDGFSGELIWRFETGDMVWAVTQTSDVNSNGTLDVVAGSDDGKVYCIEGNQNVGIENEGASNNAGYLAQNQPNPFTTETSIFFAAKFPGQRSSITIYNEIGMKVKTLFDGKEGIGEHSVVWNGTDDSGNPVPVGVYFCRFQNHTFSETKSMILMKSYEAINTFSINN